MERPRFMATVRVLPCGREIFLMFNGCYRLDHVHIDRFIKLEGTYHPFSFRWNPELARLDFSLDENAHRGCDQKQR